MKRAIQELGKRLRAKGQDTVGLFYYAGHGVQVEGVNYLDLEGCDMLNEITENMKSIGIEIHLARVKHGVMDMLEKDGVDKIIGRDHIHNKVEETVQGFVQKEIPLTKKDP